MKARKKLISLLFVIIIIHPFLFKAQGQAITAGRVSAAKPNEQKAYWNPVKLDGKSNNIKNGIEVYKQENECNTQKVILIKVVNTNNYPVKVSYQLGADSPFINVMVSASVSIEGSCSAENDNLSKLVIIIPDAPIEKAENEKQKMQGYMYSHLVITKVQ